ncbi:hypothetical protein [Microbulbifer guangxiensis]|uniref:hypothetical protein n=1 Tax=Microbulbifer guangxiensis TaxID=2904249 RepID=UPI001F33A980|nr:hypothetical protein [Microbulbifer guangxiensis]
MKRLSGVLLLSSLLIAPALSQAKPSGLYAGGHFGAMDAQPSVEGPGVNIGYQVDNGWGVHGEFTRDTVGTFGGVFGTYRTAGAVYLLFKGGVAAGRSASGLGAGAGVGFDLGRAFNLELDANQFDDKTAGHLRLSYSF